MKLDEEQVEKIKAYFQKKPVIKAYLFGSQVRGDAKEESDVDILVELDYIDGIGLQFIQMQMELEELLGKKVDLVSEQGISEYVRPFIEQDKELIYGR